ncbi:MAG: hypothetical protein WCT29_01450 [Candidatus Paceibacterota bacterium]|jgi:hypothetical protein
MIAEQFAYISIAITLVGYFFYLKEVLLGTTRPNLVSWVLWMLPPFIGVFFQLKAGAGLSIIPIFLAGFGPFLVVVFSLFRKNKYWEIRIFDIYCGLLSLFALLLYIFTHNLSIAIVFAILSDGLAAIPTILKTWKFPETESIGPYVAGIASNILGLLVIRYWIFTIYSFSAYLILVNLIIIYCIYRKRIFNLV